MLNTIARRAQRGWGLLASVWLAALLLSACASPPSNLPTQADWPLHGGDAAGSRHSALTEIHPGNVAQLERRWTWRSGVLGGWQATPIVVDGVMYVSLPFSHVAALDAATGRELWRYQHPRRPGRLCCGPANRGVAVAQGRVFVGTVDARLVALDAHNGQVLWDVTVAAPAQDAGESLGRLAPGDPLARQNEVGATGVGIAMAPQVVGQWVVVGITGVGYGLHADTAVIGMAGNHGRSGLLAAFAVDSGQRLWDFQVTGPGWEGQFQSHTADGLLLHRDLATERAAAAAHAQAWRRGGGSLWATPAVDVARHTLYFGTGNPSPQMEDSTRPGDNLYTASLLALDVRTGQLVWHHQQVPHDRWGYDVASPPVLFDLDWQGQRVPALAQASKLGWVYVHDRRDGRLLYRSDAFVPQHNLLEPPTAAGVVIAPGIAGGANWSPGALDPQRLRLVLPGIHLPTRYTLREGQRPDGSSYRYVASEMGRERGGTLTALDMAEAGRLRWQFKLDEPAIGGVLSTASGLVFSGLGGQRFGALDANTGQLLWQAQCAGGANAPPVSFQAGGQQLVAVAAGGNALFGTPQADELVVWGLPAAGR